MNRRCDGSLGGHGQRRGLLHRRGREYPIGLVDGPLDFSRPFSGGGYFAASLNAHRALAGSDEEFALAWAADPPSPRPAQRRHVRRVVLAWTEVRGELALSWSRSWRQLPSRELSGRLSVYANLVGIRGGLVRGVGSWPRPSSSPAWTARARRLALGRSGMPAGRFVSRWRSLTGAVRSPRRSAGIDCHGTALSARRSVTRVMLSGVEGLTGLGGKGDVLSGRWGPARGCDQTTLGGDPQAILEALLLLGDELDEWARVRRWWSRVAGYARPEGPPISGRPLDQALRLLMHHAHDRAVDDEPGGTEGHAPGAREQT